jgi:hypothetical protein
LTTGSLQMQRRPTLEMPKQEEPIVLGTSIPSDSLASRRSRGMLIAMLLLVLFLGIATYWVYRSAETLVVDKKAQASPATTAQPASSQPATTTPPATSRPAVPVPQPTPDSQKLP